MTYNEVEILKDTAFYKSVQKSVYQWKINCLILSGLHMHMYSFWKLFLMEVLLFAHFKLHIIRDVLGN